MGSYDGRATVITNGSEYEVHADLWCRPAPPQIARSFAVSSPVGGGGIDWGGTLHASGEADAFAMHDASSLTLRLDDGAEASFTFQKGGDLGAGTLPIRGSGTVPFDCD
ncbi:hypothetical protein M8Z33_00450 [Streptomyces sp. ZAF1911]|uniref:hypothetical protein n=1 Tax=Streptomyces sp. ZAF1911 TaxID=2944129 RepID=UPI00237A4722|nr:hypothetical protein [Streptomyces sp. ZAF1911]MDD9375161.1 hypothetical protein [Streptomyces sp. ZAF1911]